MKAPFKPLHDQVIVITGASSGIGLATAQTAADHRTKLVLAARSEEALKKITDEINSAGGEAIYVLADVADRQQVERIASEAIRRFGRIDTWVNDAGLSIYGRLEEVSEEDSRRLFDINFWGVVNGSLVALPHLRKQGGVLINLGSEVSEAVMPYQGMYSASKHAIKGFTDALRVEVEELEDAPVSITLIQPTAVDTPFPQHAKNYMDREPQLPISPIDPMDVAEKILEAATKPMRDVKVGITASLNTMTAKMMPGVGDKMAARLAERQKRDEPPQNPEGGLYRPSGSGDVRGRPTTH